jgi:hypothetical protein
MSLDELRGDSGGLGGGVMMEQLLGPDTGGHTRLRRWIREWAKTEQERGSAVRDSREF